MGAYHDEPDEFGALPRPIIALVREPPAPRPGARHECALNVIVGASVLDPRAVVRLAVTA